MSKIFHKDQKFLRRPDIRSDISPVSDPAFFGTDVTVRSLENIEQLLNGDTNSDYLSEIENLEKFI